jgi:hypothetical protein
MTQSALEKRLEISIFHRRILARLQSGPSPKVRKSERKLTLIVDPKGFESAKSSHFSCASQNRFAALHNGKCRYVA